MVDLIELLGGFIGNPLVYFTLVFVYAVLVAIVLPIPIEIALVFPLESGSLSLFSATLIAIALGKGVGAWLVFLLGVRVESVIDRWTKGEDFMPMAYRALRREGLLANRPPFGAFVERVAAELRRKGLPRHIPIKSSFRTIVDALEKFVRVTGSLGLYVLLSIPFMSDTVPIYFYAVFNEEGKALDKRLFITANFLAGVNRVAFLFILALTIAPGIIRLP